MKNNGAKETVTVIGLGYVGFPLACAIAKSKKYNVYGLDLDKSKIAKIKRRISPVEDKQAEKDIKTVNIKATTDNSVLKKSKFILICVPTPIDEDKEPDLTPVIEATKSIAKHLTKGQMVILESTVNPGVCEEVMLPILEKTGLQGGKDFELAHCPERINPGDDHWNVYNIPRNIGALTPEGRKIIANFYRSFIKAPINEVSSIKAAEATKIVENTFRDVNIAYVNELAQSFDKMGIDIMEVIQGSSNKPFAFMPHFPGCGVGGHCIPVDPYYLIKKAEEVGFDHKLLKTARAVNNSMPSYAVKKLVEGLRQQKIPLKNAKVALLGLSYKADSADLRESPALEIREELKKLGIKVIAHEPYSKNYSDASLETALKSCDAAIVATNHTQFKNIKDWGNIKVLVDGRNCLNRNQVPSNIYYAGIGRGSDGKGTYNRTSEEIKFYGSDKRKIPSFGEKPSQIGTGDLSLNKNGFSTNQIFAARMKNKH